MNDAAGFPPEELADLQRLAMAGELAAALCHDGNNFLNGLLLQVALLEIDAGDALRAKLADIRRQSGEFQLLIGQLQGYRNRSAAAPYPVDLNAAAQTAVAWFAQVFDRQIQSAGGGVRLELPAGLPAVRGTASDLTRLVTFLLIELRRHAAAAEIVVGAEAAGGGVRMTLRRAGPRGATPTKPPESLESTSARTLARRLGITLREEPAADGGGAIVLEIPAPSPQA
jgi:hypothetical protein